MNDLSDTTGTTQTTHATATTRSTGASGRARPVPDPARSAEPAQRHTGGSGPSPWMLVAGREIVVRLTNRAFIISTIITLLFIAGFGAFSIWQGNRTTTHTVAVTAPDVGAIVSAAGAAASRADDKVAIQPSTVGSDAAARTALQEGEADAWLHRGSDGWVLTSTRDPDPALRTAIGDVVRDQALSANAAAAGTTAEALQRGTVLATDRLDGQEDNAGFVALVTFIFALLFYMSAVTFGYLISGSVVQEKQSRIVEIIATAIPLRQLLAGKVVGNSVLAFAQIVLFGAVGLAAVSFTEFSRLVTSLSTAVGWFVLFFVVGFLALACLYAVAGALASRAEDLQSTTAPMTMVLILVYIAGSIASGTALQVISFLPIFSVVAMPARILAGEAMWWEPVVALVLMAGFAAATIVIGERIYRRSLMQTRGKLSWRQGLRGEA